jgi:hypothetical protein
MTISRTHSIFDPYETDDAVPTDRANDVPPAQLAAQVKAWMASRRYFARREFLSELGVPHALLDEVEACIR